MTTAYLYGGGTYGAGPYGGDVDQAEQVARALSGRNRPVRLIWRFEKRTLDNLFLADITRHCLAGSVEGNNDRDIFATARFTIDPLGLALDPLADHVAPIARLLVDGSYWQEFQFGLFSLQAPRKTYRPGHQTWTVGASDVTVHLMEATVTQSYTVSSGQNYVSGTNAVRAILDQFGLRHAVPATSLTLPADRTWPVGTPYLRVLNDLLQACNMYSLWADPTGVCRTRVREELATRTADVTYTGGDFVLAPIDEEAETQRFANQVVVVTEDPNRGIIRAVATNDDPDSPTSTVRLGRTITKVLRRDVADQATADAIASSELQQSASLYRRATILTQPDPRRWAHEVIALEVEGTLPAESWWVRNWSLELRTGAPMRHTIAKVERVAA